LDKPNQIPGFKGEGGRGSKKEASLFGTGKKAGEGHTLVATRGKGGLSEEGSAPKERLTVFHGSRGRTRLKGRNFESRKYQKLDCGRKRSKHRNKKKRDS